MSHRATYSPDDNKLRLYPECRLPKDEYERLKAEGFRWAPKQELFFAPAWSPDREDLLIEMCGEIEDEDTGLVERAEVRADRFGDYSAARRDEAAAAHAAVDSICEHIPLGQPILVGHHSERRARRDAEKIENGMRRAIKLWDTAEYWKRRAAGALAHAKYLERADVRARRIKKIEAEARGMQRTKEEAERWLRLWTKEGLTPEDGLKIANYCHLYLPRKEGDRPDFDGKPSAYDALSNSHPTLYAPRTLAEIVEHARQAYPRTIARAERWLAHYNNRLEYERAMLADAGGLKSDGMQFAVGGSVNVRRWGWHTVLRVNKRGEQVLSLSVAGCSWSIGLEDVLEYKAPTEERAALVKKAVAVPPLCNYPGDGFLHQTKAEWESTVPKWSDFPKYVRVASTETTGVHRVRNQRKPGGSAWDHVRVYLTDEKRKDPPKKEAPPALETKPSQPATEPAPVATEPLAPATEPAPAPMPEAKPEAGELFAAQEQPFNLVGQKGRATAEDLKARIEAMRASVQAGVKVVSAPCLFPTPPGLVQTMLRYANIKLEERILEPSAGTGNIIDGLTAGQRGRCCAVEVNAALCEHLRARFPKLDVCNSDFLSVNGELGTFDVILMNPPFDHGSDIRHIEHALGMLRPGGRLVGLCANGTRQREAFQPIAELWEDLPAGTFEGTGVCAALFVIKP